MSSIVPMEFLVDDLENWKYLYISEVPELPRNEKKCKLLNHHLFETAHGTLLVLELHNVEDDKQITISFPDIEEISLNDLSNSEMHKYYLDCKVRLLDYKLKDKQEKSYIGFDVDEFEVTTLLENSIMRYRIIFTNK
ncbi:MAG: hypothetical protein Q8934_23140 [Bacillota bacterium]|nr:hypothetical protein [Bacillota bacterium]